MCIYFTIIYYDQWKAPIKYFTLCWTVALFVRDDDVFASSSFSYTTPDRDNKNRQRHRMC